jgi:hypothetical protein
VATISQILMAKGQQEAESRRARAGAWQPLIQTLSNLPGQVMADRRAEQDRGVALADAEQARTARGLQIKQAEGALATAEATAAQKRQMNDLLATPGIIGEDGRFDVQKAQRTATEKGYKDILDDVLAFGQDWNDGVQKGLLTTEQIAAAKRSNQPKLEAYDPTKDIRDPVTGELKVKGTPEVKPETRSLQLQANEALKKGDTAEYARIMRVIKDEATASRDPNAGSQERSGYFTMTPVYDAQGRPIAAMKLNARTGEIELVKPDQLGGGVTARPPGNLGQRTVENEAALDSLARLKDMFDKGAKADIGPAEGRARSIGQKVPGGAFVTERFANFEAATRAFQNAMIKAITGAQMSEPEAKRIMGQIPNVNDNPTVWQAKYDQSVKNMEDLERRTRTDRGAPNATDQTQDALLDELLRGGR